MNVSTEWEMACLWLMLFWFSLSLLTAESPDSSKDSNEEEEKDSKSDEDSDSSDDTFIKDTYLNSSSVWRSYTTRNQAKGNKEGEQRGRWRIQYWFFSCLRVVRAVYLCNDSSTFVFDVSYCNPSG